MFENCTKCRHAIKRPSRKTPLQEDMKRVKGDFYVKCSAGNTERMADYFKRNFSTPYGGIDEVFDCHRKTELEEKSEKLLSELLE